MTLDIRELQRVKEEAKGQGLYGDFQLEKEEEMEVYFEGQKISEIKSNTELNYFLRVYDGKRLGNLSIEGPIDNIQKIVEDLKDIAKYGEEISDFYFTDKKPRYMDLKIYDEELEKVGKQDLIALGQEIIDEIKTAVPEVDINLNIGKLNYYTAIVNTNDILAEYKKTLFAIFIELIHYFEDTGMLIIYDWKERNWYDIDYTDMVERLVNRVRWSRKKVKLNSGGYRVIVAPLTSSFLVSTIAKWVNGENVEKRISKWKDKLGEVVLNKNLNIYDKHKEERLLGSYPFDDELVQKNNVNLVEGGVLKNFLLDVKTARKLGMESTGNGIRGGNGEIYINYGNLIFDFSIKKALKDIIKETREGILIYSLLGMETGGVNHVNGDFSLTIQEGYYIRDGEIVGKVGDSMVSGNVEELLRDKIVYVSEEVEERGGGLVGNSLLPFFVFDDINVTFG